MLTRIAPTPSGYLHIGNVCSFLLTEKLAAEHAGKILLRIDDMDNDRFRLEYLNGIFNTLQQLNISHHLGPTDTQGFLQHYSQRLRLIRYYQLLNELCQTGLVYACNCSRKHLAVTDIRCNCYRKHLPLYTEEVAWRIYLPDDKVVHFFDERKGKCSIRLSEAMPDFVVRRRDGLPAYQVTSLVDDIDYNINYIVRGEDLLPSTAAQLYLAEILNKYTFMRSRFYHHPLILTDDGKKLSKSAGATAATTLLQSGMTRQKLLELITDW